ncbi:putative Ulp1 peptidase [Medicago truncatula]|uniref:Putative Ulp1 peptidase n=1 Tax=Medicago truncatula TaxID=3880 RepID=A0A396I0Y9_MEDTR|nr:putative Ulp1 peptidase [Medicago truncatula]
MFRKVFLPSGKNKNGSSPLVVTSTPTGFYIRSQKIQDIHSKLYGPFIPNWLSSVFKPVKAMTLNSDECDMASYLFGRSTDELVLIVSDIPYCEGTREVLQCLKPREMLDQDVINLAVCMLTYQAKNEMTKRGIWFLPTIFSQYVLAWKAQTQDMLKKYHNKFMGTFDKISKIFLPVHDSECSHWFLLVIDFDKKELIYLDSLPSHSARADRMRSIKKLALYMEEFLMDSSFYMTWTRNKSNISEFSLVTPNNLGMQATNSNDCGIWVIKWMIEKGTNEYQIYVDEGTRLRIALDLILDPSNLLNETTLAVAKQSRRVEQIN